MNLDNAKQELLEESAKDHEQLLLMKDSEAEYVNGHCLPEESRGTYVEALKSLLSEDAIKLVFTNKDFHLYERTALAWKAFTIVAAKQQILAELHKSGAVYRVHSRQGEFIQCGDRSFDDLDVDRIVFLKALHQLNYSGEIHAVNDSRHFCKFELTPNFRQQHQMPASSQQTEEELPQLYLVPAEEIRREAL